MSSFHPYFIHRSIKQNHVLHIIAAKTEQLNTGKWQNTTSPIKKRHGSRKLPENKERESPETDVWKAITEEEHKEKGMKIHPKVPIPSLGNPC